LVGGNKIVLVTSGLDRYGQPCEFAIDGYLVQALDLAKHRVIKMNWDYVSIVAGLPGVGKSSFVRGPAKYCDPTFDHTHIAFTADQFITLTNELPEYSSVILDESFESMNSRVTMSKDFQRIVNHLQLIRQKHLFIFLLLPNFFDLSKGIAIFRTSHLFVIYGDDSGGRGMFRVFGRNEKRMLFIKGGKFMNYNAVSSNFRGKFTKGDNIIDVETYESEKMQHLKEQDKSLKKKPEKSEFKELICKLLEMKAFNVKQLSELTGKATRTIQDYYQNYRKTW